MTDLINRVEALLDGRGEIARGRFLSGEGVFLDGSLVVAVIGEDLCIRVGVERWESPDLGSGVRKFYFADQPVPGWVMVDGKSLTGEEELSRWVEARL
jgi:hypothetical protein